jgi:F-type H+-transporting ATPase subunit b
MEFFKENIHLGELAVQMIAFVIVFWTLKLLAWKPLLQGLETRREKIKNEFDRIAEARKEIEALKAEYASHIQKIDDESRAKIQQAIADGQRIAKEIQEKARKESQESFDKAKENLNLEVAKARVTLQREIANLSLAVSEKILKEKMNEPKQQEKILEMIKELESTL